jgi:hypothetical protein
VDAPDWPDQNVEPNEKHTMADLHTDAQAFKGEAVQSFANAHTNDLYDVVALLEAAAGRIEAATPATTVNKAAAESMHNTLRLVQMAGEKTKALADLMLERT